MLVEYQNDNTKLKYVTTNHLTIVEYTLIEICTFTESQLNINSCKIL